MQERRLLLQLFLLGSLDVGNMEKKKVQSLIASIIFAVVHLEAKHTLSLRRNSASVIALPKMHV